MIGRARWLRRFALYGVAALLVCGIAAIDRIDETPYFLWPAFSKTLAAVSHSTPSKPLVFGKLRAGFGRASLTPRIEGNENDATGNLPGIPLAGFSSRLGKPAEGVQDNLFAKSIAVEVDGRRCVFVTLDLLLVPPSVVDLVVNDVLPALNLRREDIYFAATHTHSGFGGWAKSVLGTLVAGTYQPAAERFIAAQVGLSIRSAVANLQPSTLASGRILAPEFVRNRTVKTGKSYPSMPFLAFRQATGRTAVLASFGAHATVYGADQMQISADYPGAFASKVESRDVDLALFMAGAVGSQAPLFSGDRKTAVQTIGNGLAERVLAALAIAKFEDEVALGNVSVPLTLPEPQIRFSDHWKIRPWLARKVMPAPGKPILQALRLGPTVWLSTPADYSGEFGILLENKLARVGLVSGVTSFNGDYVGYLLPGRYDHFKAYESRDMNFFGPGMGDYVQDILERLADRVAGMPPRALGADASLSR